MPICERQTTGEIVVGCGIVNKRGFRGMNEPAIINRGRIFVDRDPGICCAQKEVALFSISLSDTPLLACNWIHIATHREAPNLGRAAPTPKGTLGRGSIRRAFVDGQRIDKGIQKRVHDEDSIGPTRPLVHRSHAPLIQRIIFAGTMGRNQSAQTGGGTNSILIITRIEDPAEH
jgi:hypothetical protein